MKQFMLCLFMLGCVFNLVNAANSHKSKYAGEEDRAIKSLSAEDIVELRQGGGWGLAKAAELNGVPGPKHILEMSHEIELTPEQRKEIEQLFDEMQQAAVETGNRLIELETELNHKFVTREIDEGELKRILNEIGRVRSELRLVHLSTHLKTPDILSEEQIVRYNQLRGYSEDPCENVPDGHNAEMWKKHNNCN